MTAIKGYTSTPHDRLISELIQRASRLSLKDLHFLCASANDLTEQRMEAEIREAEFATQQPLEPDPHGD